LFVPKFIAAAKFKSTSFLRVNDHANEVSTNTFAHKFAQKKQENKIVLFAEPLCFPKNKGKS